jgi:uncharacterized tellurite resistance protein B-like protein
MNDDFPLKRKRHLRNLVVMAFADGSIGEREVHMVADRCSELGFGEKELTEAIKFGLGDDAALELPGDAEECDEVMRDLIRMMAADGKIDEGEKRLFALAAVKMGLSTEHLNQLIDSTTQS